MKYPFPSFGARVGISVSVKGYGFLKPQDSPSDLFCQPYRSVLVVNRQVPAEFMCA